MEARHLLILLVCSFSVPGRICCMPNIKTEWESWKQEFGKVYDSVEDEVTHMKTWMENRKFVTQHNADESNTFKVELNFLADQVLNRPVIDIGEADEPTGSDMTDLDFIPSSWDWRQKGAIGGVQNQGQLGDVQTIVIAECVESYGFIKTGRLVAVSEFEVRDCCVKSHLLANDAFDCIHNIGGLCSEASYPRSLGYCGNTTCTPVVQVNGGKDVPRGDEEAMKQAVYTMPVMALVDASHASFQLYRSGIYSEPGCSQSQLDHALQVVGYGTTGGQDFWICKNSWGTNWGDRGYINIARNKGNMCGIASYSQYPV